MFAKHCGITEKQIYAYLKGASEPGTKFYRNLLINYPNINLNWLISGQGEPLHESLDGDSVIAIDPAVGMVIDVEKELGIRLNDRQREAVVAVLRRELDRRLNEQKADISNLISSFTDRGTE